MTHASDAARGHRTLPRAAYPTICPADGEGCNCDEGIGDEFCDPPAALRCRCGHIRPNHYHENAPIVEYAVPGVGPCHASVYTTVPMGANVSRCTCQKFEEARLSE